MDLSKIYRPIEREMAQVEARLAQEFSPQEQPLAQLTAHVSAYRGKRIRPALVLFSGKCLGEITPEHTELAVAMELIHTATLVHDDILDEASMRRNSQTVNLKWGTDIAVMLGDYLLAQAFSLIASFKTPEITRLLLRTTMTMCAGEIHQLHRRYVLDVDEEEYFDIIDRKTASLCSACCRLGAMCSESANGYGEDLARYGTNLGIAFQIVDDCLDITGREEKVGKTLYTDLEKGKLTLPLIRLISLVRREGIEELARTIFAKNAKEAAAEILPALQKHKAFEYAHSKAQQHVQEAKRHLNRLADSEFKEGLAQLADYVLERER